MAEEERRLTEEEFVVQEIRRLRKDPYRGIHSVYSGFNEAFRKYFGTNPVEATNRLAAEDKVELRPLKGGVMIYLPGEAPNRPATDEIIRTVTAGNPSMSPEEFILEGIRRLRKDPYRGIHSVFSGLNEAFRKQFGADPIEAANRLAAEGKVEARPLKGGVMIYLPGEAPKRPGADEIVRAVTGGNPSMPPEEFILEGIRRLRKDPYRGVNTVFSGLNEAFRKQFNQDPVEFTNKLASEGKVEVVPIKGGKGVTIYLPGEGPRGRKANEAKRKGAEGI